VSIVVKDLPSPLCAICDADACERAGWTLVDFAAACLDGGARFLQIRAKAASSGWLLEAAQAVMRRAEGSGALIIVNDRADIARLAGADGVHVGQEDLSPSAIRPLLGVTACIGLSTHTIAQIEAASGQPIDYLAIGPVFGTATKETGYAAVGLERVREASALTRAMNLPLVAIGGVTLDRAVQVLRAGAQSVAVISDLLSTNDPEARARAYVEALRAWS
jgi:thiamine-phosphate pyrophosphorylase